MGPAKNREGALTRADLCLTSSGKLIEALTPHLSVFVEGKTDHSKGCKNLTGVDV